MKNLKLIRYPQHWKVQDFGSDEAVLCCPVCDMDHVHPEQVAVEQGKTQTIIRRESTNVSVTDRGSGPRGSLIALDFWCENGHVFRYELEFHKGQLFLRLYAGEYSDPLKTDELWRN